MIKNQYIFYSPHLNFVKNSTVLLTNTEQVFQITNVLRMKINDRILLLDGKGSQVLGKIQRLTKKEVEIIILEKETFSSPKYRMSLAISAIKKEKLKIVLKQATEIGVCELLIVGSRRSQVDIHSLIKKKEQLEKIIQESLEQSHNLFLPQLFFYDSWPDFFKNDFSQSDILFGDFKDSQSQKIQTLNFSKLKTIFCVGPEGGFDPIELSLFQKKRAQGVILHPSVLRVETACIVGLSQLLMVYDCKDPK